MTFRSFTRTLIVAAMLAVAGVGAAHAQQAASQPLSMDELEGLRGGYVTVDGVTFDFGANVRTYVSGELALETRLGMTPDGLTTEVTQSGQPGVTYLPGGAGLEIRDATGVTTVSNGLLSGQLRSVITNTGNDRDVRQNVDVQLTLPGFDMIQRNIDVARLASSLNAEVGLALSGGR